MPQLLIPITRALEKARLIAFAWTLCILFVGLSRAAIAQQDQDSLLHSLDGAKYLGHFDAGGIAAFDIIYELHGSTLVKTVRLAWINHQEAESMWDLSEPGQSKVVGSFIWANGNFMADSAPERKSWYYFSSDGRKLMEHCERCSPQDSVEAERF